MFAYNFEDQHSQEERRGRPDNRLSGLGGSKCWPGCRTGWERRCIIHGNTSVATAMTGQGVSCVVSLRFSCMQRLCMCKSVYLYVYVFVNLFTISSLPCVLACECMCVCVRERER